MSVAVVITFRNEDTTGPTYLPVATEEIFAAYWLPAAARLGLVWMPLFQSGTTVAIEDFASVRAEFEQMRDHFARAPEGAAMIEHLRDRSRWLSAELARLDPANIRDLFIG
ncbi:hypothetical protein [Bradyrhizobium sp. S3.2.12]|uniref:hypothetical protein n=1 Tax=Bradyrhizobium sp. S3.2.12 TaxID=3156387 RepID=UPI00339B7D1E